MAVRVWPEMMISEDTGLPVLPENYIWKVDRSKDDESRMNVCMYEVKEERKWWGTRYRKYLLEAGRNFCLDYVQDGEVADKIAVTAQWVYRTVKEREIEREAANERTRLIQQRREELAERRAKMSEGFVGEYPPKSVAKKVAE